LREELEGCRSIKVWSERSTFVATGSASLKLTSIRRGIEFGKEKENGNHFKWGDTKVWQRLDYGLGKGRDTLT